jgi:hypothetical protein
MRGTVQSLRERKLWLLVGAVAVTLARWPPAVWADDSMGAASAQPKGGSETVSMALAKTPAPVLHVGLRRSSYGGRHSRGDAWWIERARTFASNFPAAKPTMIEIVSVYLDDGTTQFEFEKPAGYAGPAQGMTFCPGKVFHEQALVEYDRQGIAAVLQVEPGNADLKGCLEVVHRAFGRHPCVIGLGVDAEWFFARESPKHDGRAMTDEDARGLVDAVLAMNPAYTLFLKHFSAKHMPPTFRHPSLYFVSDSCQFGSAKEMMADFKHWANCFAGAATGYQFGYPKDRKWWGTLKRPPSELGETIREAIPSCGYLFWVDFTADQVQFR